GNFAAFLHRRGTIEPGLGIVSFLLLIPAGKEAVEIFRVLEVVAQHRRGIGVPGDVLAEISVVGKNVIDQAAEEDNVRTSAERHPDVCHGGGAGETRIDMNDFGAALASFDNPLKPDRMVFSHRRAHNEDRVSIAEILLRSSCAASSKACAQTGHGRAMSYT